jgi:hypothetical protein
MAGMAMSNGMDREHELHTRRRGRNIGVIAVLLAFALLLFSVTIVKLGENAKNPSTNVSWGDSLLNWVRGE